LSSSTCFSAFVNFEDYQSTLNFVAAGAREALAIEGRRLCVSARSSTEWLTEMRERLSAATQFTFAEAMLAARAEPFLVLRDDARAVLAAWFGPPRQDRFQAPARSAHQLVAHCSAQHLYPPPARLRAQPLHGAKPVEERGLELTSHGEIAARTDTAALESCGPDKDPLGVDAAQSLWEIQHAELVAFFRRHLLPTVGLEEAGLAGGDLRGNVYGDASSVLDSFLPDPPHGLGFVHRLKYMVVFGNAVRAEFGITLPPSGTPVPCEHETVIESD